MPAIDFLLDALGRPKKTLANATRGQRKPQPIEALAVALLAGQPQ